MDHADLVQYTKDFPDQFAAAETFAEFAASLDGGKPGAGRLLQHVSAKYPGAWESNYRTIKRYGFTACALLLPDATKAADIFAEVALYPYQTGGVYRHEVAYLRAGAAFISALSADKFDYFGRLGASYVRNGRPYTSGGKEVLTAAKPTAAVVAAFGPCGFDEWDLATFEAIKRDDGRTLIVCRSRNGFAQRWLCFLDPGETALSLLSAQERDQISQEEALKNA